jgi:hypothetical protein
MNLSQNQIEKFWIYDPLVLFKNGNYLRVFPTENMTFVQKLNSLTLLSIYILIILIIFSASTPFIILPIVFIILLVFIYFINESNHSSCKKELYQDKIEDNADLINNKIDLLNQDEINHRRQIASPDNQLDYARWLYNISETCKENTEKCGIFEDLRFSR